MNTEQMQAAKKNMVEWLKHPQELGKAPAKIECAGTFDLYEMRYYIFKYKKSLIGKWLLGVCGGYEGDSLENCGHVFSEMKEYHEVTAVEQATAIVEMIRSYWMEQAKQAEERKENAGQFAGFVLLSNAVWDKAQLIRDLKEKWDITAEEDGQQSDDPLVFSVGNMLAAISLMPAPVPNGEAEENAKNNYMWPEAVDVAKAHKAHIMVAVLGEEEDLLERGKLYTKLVAACCRQKYAAGVYTSGVVFEPRFYEGFADMMKNDELPIFNWIWFGIYRRPGGYAVTPTVWRSLGRTSWRCWTPTPSPMICGILWPALCPMCWRTMRSFTTAKPSAFRRMTSTLSRAARVSPYLVSL